MHPHIVNAQIIFLNYYNSSLQPSEVFHSRQSSETIIYQYPACSIFYSSIRMYCKIQIKYWRFILKKYAQTAAHILVWVMYKMF